MPRYRGHSIRRIYIQARHGKDQIRLFRIVLDFLAQAGDMDVHLLGESFGAAGPDFFQQEIAGKCHATVLDKVAQKLELAGGERYDFAVTSYRCAANNRNPKLLPESCV
jgi:hypothetical protein